MGGEVNFCKSIPDLVVPSHALTAPLSDNFFVNKSPSKEAPKVPKSMAKKPHFGSLTSFFTV